MGERRVSEAPPEGQPPPVRERAGATAVGAHPVLGSRTAVAGFLADYRELIGIRDRYSNQPDSEIRQDSERAVNRLNPYVRERYDTLGLDDWNLIRHKPNSYVAEQRYRQLRELGKKAGQAGNEGDSSTAIAVRKALDEIDRRAAEELQTLCDRYGLARPALIQAPLQTPAATGAQSPHWDWCTAYQRLRSIRQYFCKAGRNADAQCFDNCIGRLEGQVKYRFKNHGGQPKDVLPFHASHGTSSQRMYLALKSMARRAEAAGDGTKAAKLRRKVEELNRKIRNELNVLSRRYESLDALAARAGGDTGRQAAGSRATPKTAQVTAAPPLQRADPSPAAGSGSAGARLNPAGETTQPSVAELLAEPPGPGSRFMPAPAAPTPTAPAPEVPLARRQAIVERFKSNGALLDAELALVCGAADSLRWDDERLLRVRADLHRLNSSADDDPAAIPAPPGIDWSGIEALMRILEEEMEEMGSE